MNKKELRKVILNKRQSITAEDYLDKSAAVCERLKQNRRFSQAGSVHVYYPIKGEVDIKPAIDYLWQTGKQVIMPRADFKTKDMQNYYVISFGQLEKTHYGLFEPRTTSPLHLGSPEVVIVPGVAFSEDRYRLGYGGGFYDRFLSGIDSYLIGVAFEEQIVDLLPRETHDQKLNLILTDQREI